MNQDPSSIVGVPVIQSIIGMIKPFLQDDRFIPPLTLILAVVWSVGFSILYGNDWRPAVGDGVIIGLASSGMYSMTRTMMTKKDK